jgi:hypothetical protein
MAGGVSIVRKVADAPAMATRKRFRGYKPEPKKPIREADVKESESLKRIEGIWKAWRYCKRRNKDCNYPEITQRLVGLGHTERDVEGFSIMLEGFQNDEGFRDKAGLFLNALINSGKGNSYVIHTRHFTEPLINIGYRNEKDVTIEGDAGLHLCGRMQSGSIVVKGDVGDYIGQLMKGGRIIVNGEVGSHAVNRGVDSCVGLRMYGGSIIVNGDVKGTVGEGMMGGRIIVNGNVVRRVGSGMEDGEIRLEGDYGKLADYIKGGRIYHKGKLIFPK